MTLGLRIAIILVLAFCLPWAGSAHPAASGLLERQHIQVELVSMTDSVQPGTPLRVGLRLLPQSGWHTYWKNPGDSGLATSIEWSLPGGLTAPDIDWPYPEAIPFAHLVNYGYYGEHLLPTTIEIPDDLSLDKPLRIQARANWLVCEEICIPGEAEMLLELPVSEQSPQADPAVAELFAWADERQPQRVEWPAQFSTEGGQLSVQVDATQIPGAQPGTQINVQNWAFFSEDDNLVDHSTSPSLSAGADQLLVAQPVSPFVNQFPDQLYFVLVDQAEGKAYQLLAQPGSLVSTGIQAASQAPGVEQIGWLAALGLALLGGLLLNLMPCVFPVLSIKALSLVKGVGTDQRGQGLAYTAGVVVSFAALAAVLLSLRSAGDAIGWGFQLQSPWIVGLLIYILFALGLCLSGLFSFGGSLMNTGQGLTERPGLSGSFFTGVLACVVASPCTAPFMGAALGAAILMPWPMAMSVFIALGLGLALPILLFSFNPALARALPRPGAWMETFKQLMAFPLYLAVVWLLWVLARQTDANALAAVMIGLVAVAFTAWLAGKAVSGQPPTILSRTSIMAGAFVAVGALITATRFDAAPVETPTGWWEEYSPARLAQLQADPEVAVFVNMTADWCLTCKVNESVALNKPAVREALEAGKVVYMKGDWTRRDAAITDYLAEFGRNGVPLYVAYPRGGGAPQVLPQVLTPGHLIDVIDSL